MRTTNPRPLTCKRSDTMSMSSKFITFVSLTYLMQSRWRGDAHTWQRRHDARPSDHEAHWEGQSCPNYGRCNKLPPLENSRFGREQTLRGGQVQTTQHACLCRYFPHPHVPAEGQVLRLVFMWSQSDQPSVRRSVQVGDDQMPTHHLQCLRIWLLQALQLQALLQCSLLQWHSPASVEVGSQNPSWILVYCRNFLLLDHLCLLVAHFLQVILSPLHLLII